MNVAFPTTTVGVAGIPGGDRTIAGGDPAEKFPVLVPCEKFPVLSFLMTGFLTAATLKKYVPSASPVAVHVCLVDDFVSLFLHPVAA